MLYLRFRTVLTIAKILILTQFYQTTAYASSCITREIINDGKKFEAWIKKHECKGDNNENCGHTLKCHVSKSISFLAARLGPRKSYEKTGCGNTILTGVAHPSSSFENIKALQRAFQEIPTAVLNGLAANPYRLPNRRIMVESRSGPWGNAVVKTKKGKKGNCGPQNSFNCLYVSKAQIYIANDYTDPQNHTCYLRTAFPVK